MWYTIPFTYMLQTRYKTAAYKIALILVYFLPVFLVCFTAEMNFLLLITSILGTNCLYENGYIDNDLITTQYEAKPTLRVDSVQQESFKSLYIIMKSSRYSLYLFSGMVIWYLEKEKLPFYLSLGGLLILAYGIHNSYRSKINIISFSLLVLLKYLIPTLIGICNITDSFWGIWAIILNICIPRIIEYAMKYFNPRYQSNIEKKRFIYYIFLTFISTVIFYFSHQSMVLLILSIYYLVFRGIGYIFRKLKKDFRIMEEKG